ncbi:hypothetical protein D9M70_417610 [compost metagenome]
MLGAQVLLAECAGAAQGVDLRLGVLQLVVALLDQQVHVAARLLVGLSDLLQAGIGLVQLAAPLAAVEQRQADGRREGPLRPDVQQVVVGHAAHREQVDRRQVGALDRADRRLGLPAGGGQLPELGVVVVGAADEALQRRQLLDAGDAHLLRRHAFAVEERGQGLARHRQVALGDALLALRLGGGDVGAEPLDLGDLPLILEPAGVVAVAPQAVGGGVLHAERLLGQAHPVVALHQFQQQLLVGVLARLARGLDARLRHLDAGRHPAAGVQRVLEDRVEAAEVAVLQGDVLDPRRRLRVDAPDRVAHAAEVDLDVLVDHVVVAGDRQLGQVLGCGRVAPALGGADGRLAGAQLGHLAQPLHRLADGNGLLGPRLGHARRQDQQAQADQSVPSHRNPWCGWTADSQESIAAAPTGCPLGPDWRLPPPTPPGQLPWRHY